MDYFVLSEHPESGSQILVFAVKKGVISEHIKTLSTAHIDPVIIDLDCLALTHSFLKTNELDRKGIVALVDLGATKTSATIVKDCLIYSMRVILSGGDDITRAIGKDFEVDFSKAEEIKIFEEGLSLLHEDNEEVQKENRSKKLSASIVKGLSRIESELNRFFHAFHSYCGEEQIDKIFITGGTSKIKNIEKYFEKKFGIQTSLFYPLDYFPHTTPSIDGEAHAVLGTSLGLALRGLSEKAKRLNFRKEEFVFKKKFEEIHGKIIQSIVFACILVGLLIGNFIFTYHSKVNEKERLQSKIEKLFVQTLPEVKVRVKGKEVEMMRNKIKETKATSFLFGVQGKGTTLDVLREISLSVSEGSKTRITNLDIASERIELSGETETFETVDKFKEGLGKSPLFKEIQVKSAEMNHRKGLVEFKFRIKRAIQ